MAERTNVLMIDFLRTVKELRTAKAVASALGMKPLSVSSRLKRYKKAWEADPATKDTAFPFSLEAETRGREKLSGAELASVIAELNGEVEVEDAPAEGASDEATETSAE